MRIDKNTKIYLGQREIVKIKKGNVVIWESQSTPPVVEPDYFYVENTYAGTNTISLIDNEEYLILMRDLQYSKDKDTWTTFTPSTTALNISLNQGEKLYIRGSGNNGGARLRIGSSQTHIVGGNINTLINYNDPDNVTLSQYAFYGLFSGDGGLRSASNLTLPATTLAMRCYQYMFSGCNNLTSAPVLPATTLANYCYSSMFNGCSSLTTAPALPATTLAQWCYNEMFSSCTSLTTAPALPATTLANYCYQNMFFNCSSLTTAPTLPATTLAESCYRQMFMWCYNLQYIKCLATVDSSYTYDFRTYCSDWVDGVSSSGTFTASDYYSNGWYWGTSGVPENWTAETKSGNPFEPSSSGIYQSDGLTVYEMGSSQGGYAVQANGNAIEAPDFNGNDYCFAMMKISADQGSDYSAYMTPFLGNGVTAYVSQMVFDDGYCPFSYNYNDENDYQYYLTSSNDGNQISSVINNGYCIWVKFVKNQGTYEGSTPFISMDF